MANDVVLQEVVPRDCEFTTLLRLRGGAVKVKKSEKIKATKDKAKAGVDKIFKVAKEIAVQ